MSQSWQAVARHYGRRNLAGELLDALAATGLDVENLSIDDLAPIDQFHIGGQETTRRLARLAALGPEMRVLDVGCGIGGPARMLAANFGCRVTGIDLSEDYCEAAHVLTERTRLADKVVFRCANALELPLPSGSFDRVWMQHVSMNVADKARLFAEARRVLADDGSLAFHEVFAGPAAGRLQFPVAWAARPEASFLVGPSECRRLLDAAGFHQRHWQDVTAEAAGWFRAALERMAQHGPPPLSLVTLVGPDFPEMARNLLRNLEEDRLRVVQGLLARRS